MAGTTDISLTWVQTLDEAMAFKRWLGERRTWLAVDTETGGLDWWRDPLRTVQFGDRHHGWCMEWKWWAGLAAEALREYEGPIAMHNCFSAGTEIVTPDGPRALGSLGHLEEVTVWTREGWRTAIAGSGGVQQVQDITLRQTKSRSGISRTVRATSGHRWELRDGAVTSSLKVGDVIPAAAPRLEHDEDGYLHGLIFADGSKGNGTQPPGPGTFKIRLCGWKAEKAGLFPSVTYPPSYDGEPCGWVRSTRDLKTLPSDLEPPAYLASFIRGWADLDGTKRDPGVVVITTADQHADESADWLVERASDLGWYVTGDYRGHWPGEFTRAGGDGLRRMVSLTEDTATRYWTVKVIEPVEEPEEVFCVNVPGVERLTLSGGIYTGNSKFDTHFLEVNGAPLKRWLIHDTRAMAHILSPAERSGLKPRAAKVLGPWATHGEDDLKIAMTKGGWDWATVPVELLWQYAAFDTVITAQLADELYPWVAKDYSSIYELEIASTQVLTDMERRGVRIDQDYLRNALESWAREQQGAAHQLKASYHIQNPASDQQVMRALEREVGWRPLVFTEKGNPKLDDEILAPIDHPVAQLTRHHREFHRMANTARSILDLTDQKTSRLHSSINPLGARTGRMSSSRPNLQNLPAGDARVRNAVVTEPENIGVKSDFDQIEMRLFAHFSGDENMLAAIRYGDSMTEAGHDGYDFHSSSARMVWGIPWADQVPKKMRGRVKTVGFGKVYGSGLEKFAATAGISLSEAQQAINAYEAAFPETRRDGFPSRVSEALVRRQREQGDPYVLTAYGRKEPCWPSEAYKAVNYLIQGTAADVLKAKLVELSRTWLGDHMLLPIHDEILFEVPEGTEHDAIRTIQEVMPERERFAVPLTTEAQTFRRWGDGYDE